MKKENEMVKSNPNNIHVIYLYSTNYFSHFKSTKNIVVFSINFSFKFLLIDLTSCFIVYFTSSSINVV